MPATSPVQWILGLDLGIASVGWAAVQVDGGGRPVGLLGAGSRVFEAGLADLEKKDARGCGRGAERRAARLRRRQVRRTARRREKVYRILLGAGLLPDSGLPSDQQGDGGARHESVRKASRQAMQVARSEDAGPAWAPAPGVEAGHVLPYLLRRAALSETLPPHLVGLALLHLAERRGFQSNRREKLASSDKAREAEKKERSVVKSGIADLRSQIEESEPRTLGGYLAGLDPRERRIRGRYTARDMYVTEFDRICEEQIARGCGPLARIRDGLRRAIFHQRPLRSQAHMIGRCDLEPGSRRAPLSHPVVQRFRVLQRVNELRVRETLASRERPLTVEERRQLLDALARVELLTYSAARTKVLGLARTARFTIEDGSSASMAGMRTDARIAGAIGADYWDLPDDRRLALWQDIWSIQKPSALARRLEHAYGLRGEQARALADTPLEDGYANLSMHAIGKLLLHMEEGRSYGEAREKEYPGSERRGSPLDRLPPLRGDAPGRGDAAKAKAGPPGKAPTLRGGAPNLRNPVVARTLTETRHVVNAAIARWGRPARIRVELARDLKASGDQRAKAAQRHKDREAKRKELAEMLREELGFIPSKQDVDKALIWEQTERCCAYSGLAICRRDLFGKPPRADVDHIVPFSRSLDDSLGNRVVCLADENRQKGNRTPVDWLGPGSEKLAAAEGRWRRWPKGPENDERLRRLLLDDEGVQELLGRFAPRDLAQTGYLTREACAYLATLYGGVCDEEHVRRVETSTGGVTSLLRDAWDLNRLLGKPEKAGEQAHSAASGDDPDDADARARALEARAKEETARRAKNRGDHRHHAIDAVCIALTGPGIVKQLSDASARAQAERRHRFGSLPEPWDGFRDDLAALVEVMLASHREPRRSRSRGRRQRGEASDEAAKPGHMRARPRSRASAHQQPYRIGRLHEATHLAEIRMDPAEQTGVRPLAKRVSIERLTDSQVQEIRSPRIREVIEAALDGESAKVAFAANRPRPRSAGPRGEMCVRRVVIEVPEDARRVGQGRRERTVVPGGNSHLEVWQLQPDRRGRPRVTWHCASTLDVAERLRRGQGPIGEPPPGAEKLLRVIRQGDVVWHDSGEGPQPHVVMNVSGREIQLRHANDGRSAKELREARVRVRVFTPEAASRLRRVRMDPLGEIVPDRDDGSDG